MYVYIYIYIYIYTYIYIYMNNLIEMMNWFIRNLVNWQPVKWINWLEFLYIVELNGVNEGNTE